MSRGPAAGTLGSNIDNALLGHSIIVVEYLLGKPLSEIINCGSSFTDSFRTSVSGRTNRDKAVLTCVHAKNQRNKIFN